MASRLTGRRGAARLARSAAPNDSIPPRKKKPATAKNPRCHCWNATAHRLSRRERSTPRRGARRCASTATSAACPPCSAASTTTSPTISSAPSTTETSRRSPSPPGRRRTRGATVCSSSRTSPPSASTRPTGQARRGLVHRTGGIDRLAMAHGMLSLSLTVAGELPPPEGAPSWTEFVRARLVRLCSA